MENSLSTYEPHACVVVYSVVARASFQHAEETLNYLWREGYTQEKSVIVVGNKADLARSRVITANGLFGFCVCVLVFWFYKQNINNSPILVNPQFIKVQQIGTNYMDFKFLIKWKISRRISLLIMFALKLTNIYLFILM